MGFGKNGKRLTRFSKKKLWRRWNRKMKAVRMFKTKYGKSSRKYKNAKIKYGRWSKRHNMCVGWKNFRFQILIIKEKEPGPKFNHKNFTRKTITR